MRYSKFDIVVQIPFRNVPEPQQLATLNSFFRSKRWIPDRKSLGQLVREFAGIGTHVLSIIDRNLKEIAANRDTNKINSEPDVADKKAEDFNNERM